MRGKIVVAPMGEIDFYQINKLASQLSAVFGSSVDILQGMRLPEEAFSEKRGQYYATVILAKLEVLKSNDREKILGILDEDLYTPNASNIIGEADRLGSVALISLYHLKQDFFAGGEEDRVVYNRLLKKSIQEVAYLYGLSYCHNPKCVMYKISNVLELDELSDRFCDNCQRKLGW